MHAQSTHGMNRAGGGDGVDGGEHQVPGVGGADRDVCGFRVADFADHDHIGRLAHHRAEQFRKAQADRRVHLRLAYAVDGIFNRILDRVDLALAVVEFLEAGVHGGSFARAGGTGEEDQAAGRIEDTAERIALRADEAQVVEREELAGAVEQAHAAMSSPKTVGIVEMRRS